VAKEPRIGSGRGRAGDDLPELRLSYFLAKDLGIANRAGSIGTFG